MTATGQAQVETAKPPNLFSRVIVGVDQSAEAREAVRQASQLIDSDGHLELLAAYEVVYPAAVSGTTILAYTEQYEKTYADAATAALERALSCADRDDVVGKVVKQRPADALIEEARRERATLIAIGSRGHGRAAGILLGSVATQVVHRAPCSVLIARKELSPTLRTIVVGVDGSAHSAAAYAAASELAERTGAELWPVVAHGGKPVDRDAVAALVSRRQGVPGHPVKALVASSADADLLVVGSRGLHGLKALGSVSERVAHEAQCSTLIVRESPAPEAPQ
ncbi:MAG TPA: universal stress protein [Gaiellaceae bacterium]|nr:universal stress protein [Gaiellaceae bacterium]